MKKLLLIFSVCIIVAFLSSCGENTENTRRGLVNSGDIIQFGDFNWLVLDVDGDYALVVTENIISHRRIHGAGSGALTWEQSDMRRYLNDDFYNRFLTTEQSRIRETRVVIDHHWDGGDSGNNTVDKIFLLSFDEVRRYFGDSGERPVDRHSMGSFILDDRYNHARIAHNVEGAPWATPSPAPTPPPLGYIGSVNEINVGEIVLRGSTWWLRTRGNRDGNFMTVYGDGIINASGAHFDSIAGSRGFGVRPALWLNMES
ncbi:MAG: DUF6273 domain-containing protein [Defluviitaleaceae bacterium]|nr:DUF6273 domain-containing protein [Defluviitaleaceae bacterium]